MDSSGALVAVFGACTLLIASSRLSRRARRAPRAARSVEDIIGKTPLLRLARVAPQGAVLYGKCEFMCADLSREEGSSTLVSRAARQEPLLAEGPPCAGDLGRC